MENGQKPPFVLFDKAKQYASRVSDATFFNDAMEATGDYIKLTSWPLYAQIHDPVKFLETNYPNFALFCSLYAAKQQLSLAESQKQLAEQQTQIAERQEDIAKQIKRSVDESTDVAKEVRELTKDIKVLTRRMLLLTFLAVEAAVISVILVAARK